jgi:hypothetical protein
MFVTEFLFTQVFCFKVNKCIRLFTLVSKLISIQVFRFPNPDILIIIIVLDYVKFSKKKN